MGTITLTGSNFEQTLTDHEIVLVDFWAAWCGPCRMFGPIFEQAAEQHPEIVFGKVDTESEQALAASANITSIPTLMAFKRGHLVFSQPGALAAAALEQLVEAIVTLELPEDAVGPQQSQLSTQPAGQR